MAIACIARPSDFAPSAGFFRDPLQFNHDGSTTINFFGVKNDYNRAGFKIRIEATGDCLSDPVDCIKMYFHKEVSRKRNLLAHL